MSDSHPEREGLTIVPVLHGRMEFAAAVRQELERVSPQVVAVELPETLREPVLRAVKRLPLLTVVSYEESDGTPVYLLIEPADAVVEAIRWGLEHRRTIALIDRDVERYGRHMETLPDSYAIRHIGYTAYRTAFEAVSSSWVADEQDAAREQTMAFHLQRLLSEHESVLCVCGLFHARRVQALLDEDVPFAEPFRRVRREGVQLHHLAERSSREVMSVEPYLSAAYESARDEGGEALVSLDRLEQAVRLAKSAREAYRKSQNEELPAWCLPVLFRFARNYALVEGRISPDLYQLLVAARGAVNDDFAWETWNLATQWPHQSDTPDLPVLELSVEDMLRYLRHFYFRRRLKRRRQNLLRLVKPRPAEERPGEWKEAWKGLSICSYQPEDIVIESYGEFLKRKAKGILSAEQSRVEPFTSSLLDGIDLRETLRNWHEGRLYVREERAIKGGVGSVIVIFDQDQGPEERYPWHLTWQGEHEQESDMAFYSTQAGEKLVGPGISRCEYGGFLLTYPPGRMYGVFEDPYYRAAETKAERLLLAGIDYSQERMVVYVAAHPPRSLWRSLAERFGKKLVYIPLGDLSPVSLRQIRNFHVLDGQPVRLFAKDFIR